ncbi:MAG: hypothetical protein Q4C70_06655, partial [Planctomycetia bacterium]|nr:hypothetical protein [Planctomycetia bacterium]
HKKACFPIRTKNRLDSLEELVPGENQLEIVSGSHVQPIKITYKKNENPFVVRIIYMTDSTGATDFQTPRENDPQNFRGKLDTAMKLMQTFTAERLNDLGFGRKTFNLELDENGDVVVHVFRGQKTAEEYYAMNDQLWYRVIYGEIREQFPMHNGRNLVIPAYTRFDAETKRPKGHTALGGGAGLALFGGGDLFTWPDSLNETVVAMTDTTPIDVDHFHDDSVGRSNYWGALSTTLGAALHELGHTFDLPHTNHVHDIMTRGHDRFNRAFIVREAPHKRNPNWYDFRDDEIGMWAPVSAYPLVVNRFFADSEPVKEEILAGKDNENRPRAYLDKETDEVVVTAPAGIQYVGAFCDSRIQWYYGPALGEEAPTEYRVLLSDVMKNCTPGAKKVDFQIRDKNGLYFGLGIGW